MSFSVIHDLVDNPVAHVLFAHGAGADKSSDFMAKIACGLNDKQINVTRFNFPYMDRRLTDGKKYPPDRMPKLLDCFATVIAELETTVPLYLSGKSMGSRVAVTLTSELPESQKLINAIAGVICLGYPFHPIGKPDNLRLAPLQHNSLPILVLQGERDKLGSKEEIDNYMLPNNIKVSYFQDGDHDLKPRVKSGFTHEQHIEAAINMMQRFIKAHG